MVKRLLLLVLVLLLALPIVAASAEINVRTYANHKVSIFIREPGKLPLADSFHGISDPNGAVTYNYPGIMNEFDVSVKISRDGDTILLENFGTFTDQNSLYLQAKNGEILKDYRELDAPIEEVVEKPEPVIEEPVEKIEEVVEEPKVENAPTTGSAISGLGKSSLKIVYYIIGGFLLVGIIVFVFGKKFLKRDGITVQTAEHELARAEKRIEKAQEDINRLKNRDKIIQARKKLETDKAELRKLQKGTVSKSDETPKLPEPKKDPTPQDPTPQD